MYRKGTICVIKKKEELEKLSICSELLSLLAGKKVILGERLDGFSPDTDCYHISACDTEEYPAIVLIYMSALIIDDTVIDKGETAKINASKMRVFLETGELE